MYNALAEAGLIGTFAIVLFGENAAFPHGSGSNLILKKNHMILMDVGGSLHGYESDVTRTFALEKSEISEEALKVWNIVREAQVLALDIAREGHLAKDVDVAARTHIRLAGYGQYFTHRLGHGIGLEGHESPYLRGGASNTAVLAANNTFSDEPGIYIENKLGVRLEDCFYVPEGGGRGVLLTEGVGGFAKSLTEP